MDDRIKSLMGAHQWDDMVDSHKQRTHNSLLGKQSTAANVRKAIQDFCKQEGINDDSCDFQSREIIISDGDIIEDILEKSTENECDLIILGGHSHLISKSTLGSTVKGVLKRSKIPVTMVPPHVLQLQPSIAGGSFLEST